MRRRPGIQGLQRTQAAKESFKVLGDHVNQTKLELMRGQMAMFKQSLEEFAIKYKSDIRKDPVFRTQFHAMCVSIGVDPLASNKGIWNRLLGFGDFYYELGVQCVEVCLALRTSVGPLVDLHTLHQHVQRKRGFAAEAISVDDLERAMERLAVLGGGWGVVAVHGQRYVRSQPIELSADLGAALTFAQRSGGYFAAAELAAAMQWTPQRARHAVQELLASGLGWLDQGPPGDGAPATYWVPGVGMDQAIAAFVRADPR